MIKDLAKFIVKERCMNSAIESAEKHADYLVTLYHSRLLTHLDNSKAYTCYESHTILQINNELSIIKEEDSRNLLQVECCKLLLMNSLEEIL